MLLINCPHCGPRDRTEFHFGGDASQARPKSSKFEDGWYDFIYLRENVRGRNREYWQHRSGCRMWLVVERDTVTHQIHSVVLAQDTLAAALPAAVL
jgi:sarcosine oxidase subunit delta